MTGGDSAADLVDAAPAAILAVDMTGVVLVHNRKTLDWLGAGEDSLVGRNLTEWMPPAARMLYETQVVPRLVEKGRVRELVLEIRRPDGSRHPLLVNADRRVDDAGSARIVIVAMDAIGRSAFERELVETRRTADAAHRELALLQDATGRLAVARGLEDLGRVLIDAAGQATQSAWTVVRLADHGGGVSTWGDPPFGVDQDEGLRAGSDQVICHDPDDIVRTLPGSAHALNRAGVESLILTPVVRQDGRVIGEICCWFRRPRTLGPDEAGTLVALARQAERVVEHLRLQDRLRHDASHDGLTGLFNRAGLSARLTELLTTADLSERSSAVIFLDLDGFKAINDLRGHSAGDEVLRTVAERLVRVCRSGDAIGRLGGDEFVIVVDHVDRDDASGLAGRVRDAVSAPLAGAAEGMPLSASVGVISWTGADDPRPSADELISAADEEMYTAKRLLSGGVRSRTWLHR